MATTNNYYKIKHGLEAPSQDAIQVTESTRPTIRPSLNLNFAQAKVLDPRITFARASDATYYDGKTVAKAEENLVLQSQAFATSPWGNNAGSSATNNVATAPDGTTTASEIFSLTGGSSSCTRYQPVSSIAGINTFSVYAKLNTNANYVVIFLYDGGSKTAGFDLSTGLLDYTTGPNINSTSITSVGNGWYRLSITATTNAVLQVICGIYSTAGSHVTVSAGASAYFWGAQLEQRDSVTAYTPTTTQPITNYIPVLQTAPSGVARFDHNPVTGESLGLEIEEQRTNLVTYSEEFDNAAWNKINVSVTANQIVAPNGTLSADQITATSTNCYIREVGVSASGAPTLSVYVKAGTATWLVLDCYVSSSNAIAWFNLTTGTLGMTFGSIASSSITSVGNGWYRCSVTRTTSGSINTDMRIVDGNGSLNCTNDSYLFAWGAQLEAGAFPTSYVKTVASQVTRSADSASMTGTNFSSWYRADEGTFFLESIYFRNGAFSRLLIAHGSALHYLADYLTGSLAFRDANGWSIGIAKGIGNKFAISYKNSDGTTTTAANGSFAVTTDFNGFTQGSLRIFNGDGYTPEYTTGHIKKLSYYPARLTNAELQSLTSS